MPHGQEKERSSMRDGEGVMEKISYTSGIGRKPQKKYHIVNIGKHAVHCNTIEN